MRKSSQARCLGLQSGGFLLLFKSISMVLQARLDLKGPSTKTFPSLPGENQGSS